MSSPADWYCLAESGCKAAQYVSAMKVSVSLNLLAGAWMWIFKQSDQVAHRVQAKVGNIVGVIENKGGEEGGKDLSKRVNEVTVGAEKQIRSTFLWAIGWAAAATLAIMVASLVVNHEYQIKGYFPWLLALGLTVAGPSAMAWAYVKTRTYTNAAITRAQTLANNKAGELDDKKPDNVPLSAQDNTNTTP